MLRISYNANGLRNVILTEAIQEVARAGFDGIELSLHPCHLDPFDHTPRDLDEIKHCLDDCGLDAACLATGADNLLSETRFEPSLIHPDSQGRSDRVDLIKRSIDMARQLNVPVLNFASGIRHEEVNYIQAWEYLVDGIHACLDHAAGDVVLAIEPEPGFFVESNVSGLALLSMVEDNGLRLNQDVGHENVCQTHYIESILLALPYTRHMHVEDIKGRHHDHRIPGEGDIDFRSLLRTLIEERYPHFISVELYNHANVYQEAMRKSLGFLRSTIDGLVEAEAVV